MECFKARRHRFVKACLAVLPPDLAGVEFALTSTEGLLQLCDGVLREANDVKDLVEVVLAMLRLCRQKEASLRAVGKSTIAP